MRRSVLVLSIALVLAGCKKKTAPAPNIDQATLEEGGVAQARLGGDPDDQPRVSFVIDTVHRKQQPSSAPPWHVAGGEWTFFDAHLSDGTKMGFGILEESRGGSSFTFGKGMLTVPDAENGAKLAKRLSTVFHGKLPPANARGPLRIEPISLAILGKNSRRSDNGFAGRGSWTATKLFLQRPGIEAEVFFNFDLESKKGEFAEKDSDYANDLVAFVARDLRDGPPPPRTPENDPQVSAVGPKLEAWNLVQGEKARLLQLDGKRFLFTVKDGAATRVMSAPIAEPTKATELARTEDSFRGFSCAKVATKTCILSESKPSQPNSSSSSDPTTYSLVDLEKKTKRALSPPVEKATLGIDAPISPDGALIVWQELKTLPKDKQKIGPVDYWILHLVPATGGQPIVVEEEGHTLDVIGWTGTGATMKAVVQDGSSYDRKKKPTWSLLDPKTGTRTAVGAVPPGIAKDTSLSPDGKHRATCKDGSIVITDAGGGGEKRFVIHPDDRKALEEEPCVSWVSPKYLLYFADRRGFVDIDTMKLSFLFPPGEEPKNPLSFSDDFAWAAQTTPEGIRLAKVVIR